MATIKIMCVRDIALGSFGQPYFQSNLEIAKRNYSIAINDKSNQALYPIRNDLELWCLGDYDDNSGKIDTNGCPCIILNLGEAVIREEIKK